MTLFNIPVNHPLCRAAGCVGLILMTDQSITGPIQNLLPRLPTGTLVIFRDYEMQNRVETAAQARDMAADLGQHFFVAKDVALARDIKADGVHLPSFMMADAKADDFKGLRLSAACHSRADLALAAGLGVDMALISPVFATKSHAEAEPLGLAGLAEMRAGYTGPVAALGGVNATTAPLLRGSGITAVAAIRGLVDE